MTQNVLATSSTASASTPPPARRYDVVDPSTGEVFATAPLSGAEDVDRGLRGPRRRPSRRWRDTTPAERQRALLKIADAIEARADELVDVESREHRQAARAHRRARSCRRRSTRSGSSPARPGCSRAASAGEYMAGHTSLHPARADRRRRPGHAVELPADDGGLEVRARRSRPATPSCSSRRDTTPASHAAAGRDRQRVPPAGRASTWSAATGTPAGRSSSTRSRRWSRSPARSGPAWRSPASAAAAPEAGPPRARRQGAGDRLRRRRHRGGRRGHRAARATSTPARTAPRRPGCSPGRASTTTSSPRSPSRPATPRPACPTTRTSSTAR